MISDRQGGGSGRVAAPRGFAQILAMSFNKLARGKSGRRDFA
jgi:hypothetical protein